MHLSFNTNNKNYILGDIHGDSSPILRWNHLCSDSVIIQVGDFGLSERLTLHLSELLYKKNNNLIIVRGNHERFIFNDHKYSNIFLVSDYSTLDIDGQIYQLVGGAISLNRLDKIHRSKRYPDRDSFYDINEPVKYIPELINPETNILITHTAPRGLIPFLNRSFLLDFLKDDVNLKHDLEQEERIISQIFSHYASLPSLKRIYSGHYHRSVKNTFYNNIPFRCLDINEIHSV